MILPTFQMYLFATLPPEKHQQKLRREGDRLLEKTISGDSVKILSLENKATIGTDLIYIQDYCN